MWATVSYGAVSSCCFGAVPNHLVALVLFLFTLQLNILGGCSRWKSILGECATVFYGAVPIHLAEIVLGECSRRKGLRCCSSSLKQKVFLACIGKVFIGACSCLVRCRSSSCSKVCLGVFSRRVPRRKSVLRNVFSGRVPCQGVLDELWKRVLGRVFLGAFIRRKGVLGRACSWVCSSLTWEAVLEEDLSIESWTQC